MGIKRKIFVVDDHSVMRWGYIALLNQESDLEVCGEAGTALEALEKVDDARPDLTIVDISLDGMSGIELTKHLQTQYPEMPILIVSMHEESLYGERALRAGAKGYIMKKEARVKIVDAIRHLLRGSFYLSDEMSTKILLQYQGRKMDEEASSIDRLSDRELEVFELFGRGYSTREIAEALLISPKTVDSHRTRIKTKLALESTPELLQRAVHWVQMENIT